MKGHMEDGKFHPHTTKKGVRKSRDQTAKTQGVKVERKARSPDPIARKVIREFESQKSLAGETLEINEKIEREVERRKQKLIDTVIKQIGQDIADGDVTAIDNLLSNMLSEDFGRSINENYENLFQFLPETTQNKLNRESEFP